MKAFASQSLQSRLLLSSLIPLAVGGVTALVSLSVLASPESLIPLVIAGVISSGACAATTRLLTQRLAQLAHTCQQSPSDVSAFEAFTTHNDEISHISRAIADCEKRYKDSVDRCRLVLENVHSNLGKLSDGVAIPDLPSDRAAVDEVREIHVTFQDAAKKIGVIRQRLAIVVRIVQELPTPIMAVDTNGTLRYLNTAAEKLLGQTSAQTARKPLPTLIAKPAHETDPWGRPILDSAGITQWLQNNDAKEVITELKRPDGLTRVALCAKQLSGSSDKSVYIVARDLTEEVHRLELDRVQTRELTLRASWDSFVRAGGETVDAILACTRLLASDAKQSSGRAVMIPRITAIRQSTSHLEAYLRSLRWLNQALAGQLPEPMESELLAVEPIRAAIDQMSAKLKARNLTVNITDQGGWIYADEEWIKTLFLGILLHSTEATEQGVIGIHLNRLAASESGNAEQLEFKIYDAGPALSPDEIDQLACPFGGSDLPSFLKSNSHGFIPGLILARQLAEKMGGHIDFATSPSGKLFIRVRLAARITKHAIPRLTSDHADLTPIEELVIGWKLGAA